MARKYGSYWYLRLLNNDMVILDCEHILILLIKGQVKGEMSKESNGAYGKNIKLTLYWNIISPYARAVKVLLDIGKIEHKLVNVDLLGGQQRKQQFAKINPKKQVPVLVELNDNGEQIVITESLAIMTYLCEMYPKELGKYNGKSSVEKAHVMEYLSWAQFSFIQSIGTLWTIKRDFSLKFNIPIPVQKIKTGERKIQVGLKTLDQMLSGKEYLVPNWDRPSIADILVYFLLTLVFYVGKDHFSHPNIVKWVKKMYKIPQIKVISHQWFSIAKEIAKLMQSAPIAAVKSAL